MVTIKIESESKMDKQVSNDTKAMLAYEAGKKSAGISYVLWFFVGGLGGHRFYLGYTGSAVGMLVLAIASILLSVVGIGLLGLIALGIWVLVDAFLIPGMVSEYNGKLASSLS